MQERHALSGTIRYVYTHWPRFALLYGGIILMLLVIGYSVTVGWGGFVSLATAVMGILAYFFAASLWLAHQLYDWGGIQPHHVLFEMGFLESEDSLVYIDLGIRRRPIDLSRRLTTGRITVVDVYNPQWAPNRALARWRSRWQHPPPDPRLTWRDGQFNLLPLPDQSTNTVILCQIASELWQHGDRLMLLAEIRRILTPDGRLLFAEPGRSQIYWLILGPAALNLPSPAYWRRLLEEAGFRIRREQTLRGLITCYRAQKPSPGEARQLTFDLRF